MLGITTKTQAKATEKLSSGYKINRAADDAAGLSISEKMRKQIRGLTQASANAQDGISAVQTAEGALTEVHDMLQRMNELAVKAANGTNSKDDRDYIQAEVDQLVTEIDRVATTTKFNETYLLKGTNGNDVGKLTYSDANTASGLTFDEATGEAKVTGTKDAGTAAVADMYSDLKTGYAKTTDPTYDKTSFTVGTKTYVLAENIKAGKQKKDDDEIALNITFDKIKEKLEGTANTKVYGSKEELFAAIKEDLNGNIKSLKVDDLELTFSAFADLNKGLDVSLHVGADSTKDNKIGLTIEMMSARGLGVNGIRVDGEDFDNATASIDTIKAAIQKVSEQRSALGAVQNRLEHTINNLDNVVENTTSAESAIRDTDMASQMVSYSNNNILAQAGQAMLAQANQSNQGVLSLLG
jgi:flagellin